MEKVEAGLRLRFRKDRSLFNFEGPNKEDFSFDLRVKEDRGGLAQLGEHLPCKQGVKGSNPLISTSSEKGEEEKGNHKAKTRE